MEILHRIVSLPYLALRLQRTLYYGIIIHLLIKLFLRFDEIPKQMIEGKVDYGLVIHETRFVYKDLGLELVCDLGERFENDTGSNTSWGYCRA